MLKKKLIRDLRRNWSQFFVIFMMVLLSVMVFAGVHAYMDGMRISAEQIYEKYNLADMWLTGEGFSGEDLEKVRSGIQDEIPSEDLQSAGQNPRVYLDPSGSAGRLLDDLLYLRSRTGRQL